jgi:hypothetical protein
MSTQASRSTMTLWRCAATLVLALAAGHVSAQLAREPVKVGDDGRQVKTGSDEDSRPKPSDVLSVPLTGTGVEAPAGTPPPDKDGTKTAKKPTEKTGGASSKSKRDESESTK